MFIISTLAPLHANVRYLNNNPKTYPYPNPSPTTYPNPIAG